MVLKIQELQVGRHTESSGLRFDQMIDKQQ